MDEIKPSRYIISIPFGAFLTANSILIAADFIFTQLWFNFQPTKSETQLEAIGVGAIFVYYFVIVSIVSMILAILGRNKGDGDEVQGRPVILFFFSLVFTMCYVFQAMVTLAIKIYNQSTGSTLYQHDSLWVFIVGFILAVIVTISAIVKPGWWDKLFGSFKDQTKCLMCAIFGIFVVLIGGVFSIARQSICHGTIISIVLIVLGLITLISAYLYCRKKCLGKAK